jgi:cysteine dioxygenase
MNHFVTHQDSTFAAKTIDRLCVALGPLRQPLTAKQLLALTSQLRASCLNWGTHLTFSPHRFSVVTVFKSPWLEINLIGWQSGQFSSVHNHRGSRCCVLVLDGILTNIDYRIDPIQGLKEIARLDMRSGNILCRNDCEVHCCGNQRPQGCDLATLHLYSPPLRPLTERQCHG